MFNKLAFVTITITQSIDGLPAGSQFRTDDPVKCSVNMAELIRRVEELGSKANGSCEYTFAPARSIRPKARGQVSQP